MTSRRAKTLSSKTLPSRTLPSKTLPSKALASKAPRSTAADAADSFRDADYAALAQFRYELRKFLAFSESAAREEGLTSHQHQALLAIKGFSQDHPLSVGDLAKYLLIQNHSAVELVDRMTRLGLLQRAADPDDGRRILVRLSAEGERRLKRLSKAHLQELNAIGTVLSDRLAHFRDQQN
jgi:DNA-binding MarR family transcriptional regulator